MDVPINKKREGEIINYSWNLEHLSFSLSNISLFRTFTTLYLEHLSFSKIHHSVSQLLCLSNIPLYRLPLSQIYLHLNYSVSQISLYIDYPYLKHVCISTTLSLKYPFISTTLISNMSVSRLLFISNIPLSQIPFNSNKNSMKKLLLEERYFVGRAERCFPVFFILF